MSDTPIADMVEKMLSGGMSAEMVVLAVGTAERAALRSTSAGGGGDPAGDRRRERDRLRKAAARSGVCGQSADTDLKLPLSSSKKVDSTDVISKESKKEVAVVSADIPRTKRKVGHALPADWAPNAAHFALGESLGVTRQFVLDLAMRMRAWADSEDHRAVARKSNWDQAFSGWLRREAAKSPRGAARADKPSFFSEAMGGQNGKH